MADTTQPEPGSAQASFAAHVQAFHAGLPAEEQALLEQVFALAQSATPEQGDVQGFAVDAFLTITTEHQKISPSAGKPTNPLGG
jgi:hypothetical protein